MSQDSNNGGPDLRAEDVDEGRQIRRRPRGRPCSVARVSEDRLKVLIKDGRTSTWANMSTILSKWY
jgi:hypothetical protein